MNSGSRACALLIVLFAHILTSKRSVPGLDRDEYERASVGDNGCCDVSGAYIWRRTDICCSSIFNTNDLLDYFLIMATVRIDPPVFNSSKNYERYKIELLAWREVTTLSKVKQGIAIALTLPDDESSVREKVFDELSIADLKSEDGLDKLIAFLDKILGKDDLEDILEKFEDFEDFRRGDENTSDYIAKFDQKYSRIKKKGLKLPSEILAFKLLKRANLSKEEKLLVLTGMDYTQKDTLYDQAKKSLKKFKCDVPGASAIPDGAPAIKLEPAFLAENEEALWAAGYVYRGRGRGRGQRRGQWYGGRGGTTASRYRSVDRRSINPLGPDGQPVTCRACGSYRHLIKDCPDSWENLSKAMGNVNITSTTGKKIVKDNAWGASHPPFVIGQEKVIIHPSGKFPMNML